MLQKTKNKKYIQLRDEFHKKRDGINEIIAKHKSEIKTVSEEVSKLEGEIRSARPRIPGAERNWVMCKRCDIFSMVYVGTEPGQGIHYTHYDCKICGYHTYIT